MTETTQLGLPFVAAAQAQKHVTVNEAFARLDALANLRLQSTGATTPPLAPEEGEAYFVPSGAVNAWDGQSGKIAVFANGGWVFVTPKVGWQAYVEDIERSAVFDGTDWLEGAVAISENGAATLHRVLEFDHVISAGADNSTTVDIPAGAQVIGVTGVVTATVAGTGLTGWRVGVAGSDNRYGSGLNPGYGSWLRGLSGAPVTYWSDTPLLLSSEGGDFTNGTIRLAIHITELVPPQV